ncbi:NAD-dependent epimerase [Sphaerisporangium rufum]|uniref:NAD-dependent epimerase n=1 Tax=Sphaerisporangium rufum TaxID=1381558 RepID=A0A919V897_9ACTN|nr:NAD-dependent epimerase/dehydratase family protein [Sphaerisporangium rufum]GII81150.1 NAD-dependent epimerase [Sphaerisporangium rufum]
MGKHVIIGAGQVGGRLAELLADAGHEIVVVTRSGSGPVRPEVTRVAADAADAERLAKLTAGADALYNCVNPPYHRWPRDWPPMATAMLGAAERGGAALVILGNLYGYGPVDGLMTEETPLAAPGVKGRVRVRMWQDALAAHRAGRVRVTEVRGSDYFGPGQHPQQSVGGMVIGPVVAGRPVRLPVDPDLPHTATYLPDVARALMIAGTDERAYGRAWHVPSPPAWTIRRIAERTAAIAGAPAPRISVVPHLVMRAIGLVSPQLREMEETRYQWVRPYVMDSTAFTETFGMAATPMERALEETIAWVRAQPA